MKNEEKQRIQKELGIRDSDAIWDILKIIKEPIIQYEELARKIDQKTQQAEIVLKSLGKSGQRKVIFGISIGLFLAAVIIVCAGYCGYLWRGSQLASVEVKFSTCLRHGGSIGTDSNSGRIACFGVGKNGGYYIE